MIEAGIVQPRLAITELQMFAHVTRGADSRGTARLTGRNLVSPGTLAEALYDVLIYHASVRLSPFVDMVTHSATVNHGGGLRKENERVYANPCYYAQAAFAAFNGAVPVAVAVEAPVERVPGILPDLKNSARESEYGALDALAAENSRQELLISLVHRGTQGPLRVTIEINGLVPGDTAELWQLAAEVPWAANSAAAPTAVQPQRSSISVQNHVLELTVPPCSVLRLTVPRRR
jgi:alpha-L-arabinofuranosidase